MIVRNQLSKYTRNIESVFVVEYCIPACGDRHRSSRGTRHPNLPGEHATQMLPWSFFVELRLGQVENIVLICSIISPKLNNTFAQTNEHVVVDTRCIRFFFRGMIRKRNERANSNRGGTFKGWGWRKCDKQFRVGLTNYPRTVLG